jgi:hypothetical protein
VACADPDELDELLDLEPVELELEPLDPVLAEPVLAEPLELEPLELELEPLELDPVLVDPVLVEPVLVEVLVVVSWVEPGSVAATAPVAITLARPTPAVTAVSRRIPRRRASAAGETRPSVLLGIGNPSPSAGSDYDDASANRTPPLACICVTSERWGMTR